MTEPPVDELEGTPYWMWALFGVQAFGWVLHALFGGFLVLYIANVPGRTLPMLYALVHIVVSIAAGLVFALGPVLPAHPRKLGQVAYVHSRVAALIAVPMVLAAVSIALENTDSALGVLRPLGVAGLLIAAALAGLIASRRSQTSVLACTVMLAVPAVFVGAFMLLVLGLGIAGVSA